MTLNYQKAELYSKLYDEHTSGDANGRANLVWNRLELKDVGEHHDLYLKTELLFLFDAFEEICV